VPAAINLPDESARCSCGVTHRVAIEEIVVAPDAFERLGEYAESKRWQSALLVMDANTEEAAGARVTAQLADFGIGKLR
jgi:glycerol dehydrogenase-like iron-containing ADH family enzyme